MLRSLAIIVTYLVPLVIEYIMWSRLFAPFGYAWDHVLLVTLAQTAGPLTWLGCIVNPLLVNINDYLPIAAGVVVGLTCYSVWIILACTRYRKLALIGHFLCACVWLFPSYLFTRIGL